MEATLDFDLPEDNFEFRAAIISKDLYFAISEMDEFLRNKIKHGDYEDNILEVYQECRDHLGELTNHLKIEE